MLKAKIKDEDEDEIIREIGRYHTTLILFI
jgi:hypothetical protein